MPSDDTSSCSLPFEEKLRIFFFYQMERRTSAFLYGSAATGNWVAARSDLDILILISEDQIESLGEMISRWKATPEHPILDGYALFLSRNVLVAMHLEEFYRSARLPVSKIRTIDLWNMKYKSKYLFGLDFVKELPDVKPAELRDWARKELRNSSFSDDIPKVDPVLSGLIWSVSWAARMLMLARGIVSDSKQEALMWLSKEFGEIREPVGLLLNDFYKSDREPISITSDQSEALRRFLLKLLILESRSASA